jgi:hypothetical protein
VSLDEVKLNQKQTVGDIAVVSQICLRYRPSGGNYHLVSYLTQRFKGRPEKWPR